LENAVEDRADVARGARGGIGVLHLSEDFGFADHLRIETGGDGAEVGDGGGSAAFDGVRRERCGFDFLNPAECGGDARGGGLGSDGVDLDAVAGGEDTELAHGGFGTQGGCEGGVFLGTERETFAHFEGCGVVAGPEEKEMRRAGAHGIRSETGVVTAAGAGRRDGTTIQSESSGTRKRSRPSQAIRWATQRWRSRCTSAPA
jgi:hypothetical protein